MNMQLLSVAEFYSEKFTPGSAEALDKAVSYGLPFSLFGFAVVFGVLAVKRSNYSLVIRVRRFY